MSLRDRLLGSVTGERSYERVNGNERDEGNINRRTSSRRLEHLSASAVRIDRQTAAELRKVSEQWQDKALMYYDLIGEIHFAAGFYSRGLTGLRLYAAELDDDGEVSVTNNALARAALARVRDPAGGRDMIIATYARLAFITGEAFLLWERRDGIETWEVVSGDELRMTGDDTYVRVSAPSLRDAGEYKLVEGEPQEDGEAVAYRIWTPHPRHSKWADSPMRAILDVCEELVLLTHAVAARVTSRLAGNGILTWPDELSDGGEELDGEDVPGDEDALADTAIEDFVESAVAPIENHGSAAQVVPFILRGPAEFLKPEYLRWLQVRNPEEDYKEAGLREEAIRRIALALDLPPEALLGMTDANHWSAWQVDETIWKTHLKPIAQALSANLTSAYLQPALVEAGMDAEEAGRYVVAFDEAAIVTKPDRAKDAQAAFDRFVVGPKTLRDSAGFNDDDAPTPEELEVMYLEAGITAAEPVVEEPVVDVDVEVEEELPEEEPEDDGTDEAEASLASAARFAIRRSRAVAGNRIAAAVQGKGVELERVHPALLASHLGPERVAELVGIAAEELVRGSCAADLVALGVEAGMSLNHSEAFAERVELHAAATLYEANPSWP